MSQDAFDDLRQQVCLSLRMTLAYLSNHAHLRELFTNSSGKPRTSGRGGIGG